MLKKVKIISIDQKTSKADKPYWKIIAQDGRETINGLCFDEQISKIKAPAEVEFDIVTKSDKNNEMVTYFNYPKKDGEKKGWSGGGRGKSPEELTAQAITMTLSYAKDVTVAFINQKSHHVESPEMAITVTKKVFESLYNIVKKGASLKSPAEETAKEIEDTIDNNVFKFINEQRKQGYKINENIESAVIARFAGEKDAEGKLHPFTKPYKEFSLDDKKRAADRSISYHTACIGRYAGCPYALENFGCKWTLDCLFAKNIDARR